MSNISEFKLDKLSIEQTLRLAGMQDDLQMVLVLGKHKDDSLYVQSSDMTVAQTVLLLEVAKKYALDVA